jgi:hypothetical protein
MSNKNPFIRDGKLIFNCRPMRDLVFIWPEPQPESIGNILIPEKYREDYANSVGYVLATGKGYFDPVKLEFIPNRSKVGSYIIWDLGCPWEMELEAWDGLKYVIKVCGEKDVQCILHKEENETASV